MAKRRKPLSPMESGVILFIFVEVFVLAIVLDRYCPKSMFWFLMLYLGASCVILSIIVAYYLTKYLEKRSKKTKIRRGDTMNKKTELTEEKELFERMKNVSIEYHETQQEFDRWILKKWVIR